MKDDKILQSWETVNSFLRTATAKDEEQVKRLFRAEQRGRARVQVLLRLYSKSSKLRMQRERKEIFGR